MKQIVIIGAGGFGREVQWLIENINKKNDTWSIKGYVDDSMETGRMINGYPVLGGMEYLLEQEEEIAAVCAIGSSQTRKKIIQKFSDKKNIIFPNLIDPSVQMSDYVTLGIGNVICGGSILTVNIEIGNFNIINLSCTVGHDVKLSSFVTVYPGANISGCVTVGEQTEIGTGTQVIQGLSIGRNTIVGAGSVVNREIADNCVAVGVPARVIKNRYGD